MNHWTEYHEIEDRRRTRRAIIIALGVGTTLLICAVAVLSHI